MRRVATWGILVVLAVLLVIAARRLNLARVAAELRVVRAQWVVAAVVAYATILPLWGAQWHLLAPRSGHNTFRRMVGVVAMASATLGTTAFFMGEAASAILLTARVRLTKSEVLSVMAMDQLLVGLAKLAVLLAAALMLSLPAWLMGGMITLATGVVALLVATVLGAWHFRTIVSRAERIIPARGLRAMEAVGESLTPLRSPRRGGGALLIAFAKMLAEITAIWCIQRAFGVQLPVASAVLVLAGIQMATLLPIVPANLGVYEGAIVVIYSRFGIPTEVAVGMAVVQHAASFTALVIPGYAWFGRTAASRRAVAA